MPLSLGPEGRLFLGTNVVLTLFSELDYYAALPGIPSPCWGCTSVPLAAMIGFNNLLDKKCRIIFKMGLFPCLLGLLTEVKRPPSMDGTIPQAYTEQACIYSDFSSFVYRQNMTSGFRFLMTTIQTNLSPLSCFCQSNIIKGKGRETDTGVIRNKWLPRVPGAFYGVGHRCS